MTELFEKLKTWSGVSKTFSPNLTVLHLQKIYKNWLLTAIWLLLSLNKLTKLVTHRSIWYSINLIFIKTLISSKKRVSLHNHNFGSTLDVLPYRSSRPEVFYKKVFLEISQHLQENTCARLSFLIRLQPSSLLLY